MKTPFVPLSLILILLLGSPADALSQAMKRPELLPRDLEIELALSAIPPHLRAEARVYVLGQDGYTQARAGTNGFACLVRRHGAVPGTFSDSLAPVCYDREGSNTLLPAVLDEVHLLQQGVLPEQVAAKIEAAWAEGKYTAPGPGVSYMLSPVFRLNGRNDAYVPHLMFYAPHKADSDVGASGDRLDYVPFIQAPGRPSAVMVVPVGVQERAAIQEQEQALIARVQQYLETLGTE
jgi:hypothetical protein